MLCFHSGCVSSGISRVESLLINIGGKLLMLQRLHEKEKRKKVRLLLAKLEYSKNVELFRANLKWLLYILTKEKLKSI